MHRIIGDAIGELRRLHDWSQPQLAREISRHSRRGAASLLREHISQWERGIRSPDSGHRIALAHVAESAATAARKKRHLELAERIEVLVPIFLAGLHGWKLVSCVSLLKEQRHQPVPERPAQDVEGVAPQASEN